MIYLIFICKVGYLKLFQNFRAEHGNSEKTKISITS